MDDKKNIIDLGDFRTIIGKQKSKVFTGRDRGGDVRDNSNLDSLFEQYHKVKIIIPKDTFSITPSFLEEFFYNIVSKYGLQEFRDNVEIESNGYNIETPLEEGIQRIIQRMNGLDK